MPDIIEEQPKKTPELKKNLDDICRRNGFNLELFLEAIGDIGELRPNSVSDNLSNREKLSDNAQQFFLQAEPKEAKSHQTSIDKLCQGKLRLISEGYISWQDIEAIDAPDHPLLNNYAVSRMTTTANIVSRNTTLEQEIKYWKEQGRLLNSILALLGDAYITAITTEMTRLEKKYIDIHDKHKKVKIWLNAAAAELSEKEIPPHEKFRFYKSFRIQDGETLKNIKGIFKEGRVSDFKTPKSYTRISSFEAVLNDYEYELRFGIYDQAALERIEAELKWEKISLIREPNASAIALTEFDSHYPTFFEDARLPASAFIFKPKNLGELLEKLKDIQIKWADVRTIINGYYKKKGVERASYTVESWSHFFVTLTCNVSPLVKKLDKYAANAHGPGEVRSILCLDQGAKKDIINEIHQHIRSLSYNKKGKELSESGRMAAQLLHLLFGLGMNVDSAEFTDFKAKEMLNFLASISRSSTADHHTNADQPASNYQPPVNSTPPLTSQQPVDFLTEDVLAILPPIPESPPTLNKPPLPRPYSIN